jgi:hypothetical protein
LVHRESQQWFGYSGSMKPADEFFARVPEAFYPSGVSIGGEWILEGEKGAYHRRHREAAAHSYALLKVTPKVASKGQLHPCGTSQILALPQ